MGACGVPELKASLSAHGATVLTNPISPAGAERGYRGAGWYRRPPTATPTKKHRRSWPPSCTPAWGDPFWILLAHRNNRFPSQYSLLGADLVVSGHAHGGIIRLPGTDGLISHDLELFPSYTAGLYEENGSLLFVTRGLGNSGPSFRLFNRPEIAVVTLRRG